MKKAAKTYKLTTEALRTLIQEEAAKFTRDTPEEVADDVEEVDAGDLADTLEKPVNMMKALKIEEAKLVRRLARVREHASRLAKKIAKK